MTWIYNDGGRAEAGFKGECGDCVTRSIAIAAQLPYRQVYDALKGCAKHEQPRAGRKRSSVRDGVKMPTVHRYMCELGWEWVPTMRVGAGCTTHLRAEELPKGRLVVRVTRHITAVIDGVVHDTHDPGREGRRCVYGYWIAPV